MSGKTYQVAGEEVIACKPMRKSVREGIEFSEPRDFTCLIVRNHVRQIRSMEVPGTFTMEDFKSEGNDR